MTTGRFEVEMQAAQAAQIDDRVEIARTRGRSIHPAAHRGARSLRSTTGDALLARLVAGGGAPEPALAIVQALRPLLARPPSAGAVVKVRLAIVCELMDKAIDRAFAH